MPTKPKVLILRTAGTNCDQETAHAFRLAGGAPELVHINQLFRKEKTLRSYDILAIPGGFSYGDDIAAGKILANELKFRLRDSIVPFAKKGHPIIGICNGFQVLVKTGLLPEVSGRLKQTVTLTFNDSGHFEDRWVYLRTNERTPCLFARGISATVYLPVAHGEGKFYAREDDLERIAEKDQIVFTYVDRGGNDAGYPANPNGSLLGIAGICNPAGNVLGMMPHPERNVIRYHHPRWTRERRLPAEGAGLQLFRNAVNYCKG